MSRPRDNYLCGVGKRGQSRLAILNEANQAHIKELLNKLDLRSGMRVLDVACGTGEITCQMAEKNPDISVVGIDFSEEQINVAKENMLNKKLNNIVFLVMSAYEIKNLKKKYVFDRIFIRWILGHLQDPRQVIESCKALLKPQGILVCEEGDINTHHCESAKQSFLQYYGFFVTNIINLQSKRGVDAGIGAKLPALCRTVFQDEATIETESHQLTLKNAEQKEAVTTAFLDEVGQKFIDEGVLTSAQLNELKLNLDTIAHESESKIFYTTDIAVTVKLR